MKDIFLLKSLKPVFIILLTLIIFPPFYFAQGGNLFLPNSEFQLDTTAVYGPIRLPWPYGTWPVVCFGDSNFLVAWQDWRRDDPDIFATRVSQSGVVLDTAGIDISTAIGNHCPSDIGFDGTNYFIFWEFERPGNPYHWDIYGTRISQSGQVLDSTGIPLIGWPGDQQCPSIAFDGTNFLIVWENGNLDPNIYAARVTPSGTVLDPNGIVIANQPYIEIYPSVAFDGTNYLVVWTEELVPLEYDLYGKRVSPAGIVLDTAKIVISNAPGVQGLNSVAFDGINYLGIDNINGLRYTIIYWIS